MNIAYPIDNTPLSQEEVTKLQYWEAKVVTSIHDMGEALWNIKNQRLYREQGTWEEYCLRKFGADLNKVTVDKAISAYKESTSLKNGLTIVSCDKYEETIDSMSQRQLLASKQSGLPLDEKIGAVIASVDDETGEVDSAKYYEELEHRSNPQGIREGSVIAVKEHEDVIEEFHNRTGKVIRITGNVCKIKLHAVEDGGVVTKKEEVVSFVFSELNLISHPEPKPPEAEKPKEVVYQSQSPTPKRSPLEQWKDEAIALFKRVLKEGESGLCGEIEQFLENK